MFFPQTPGAVLRFALRFVSRQKQRSKHQIMRVYWKQIHLYIYRAKIDKIQKIHIFMVNVDHGSLDSA